MQIVILFLESDVLWSGIALNKTLDIFLPSFDVVSLLFIIAITSSKHSLPENHIELNYNKQA